MQSMPAARLLLAALLLSNATPATAGKRHKNCTQDDAWSSATLSYDLSKCATFNATAVLVDADALALALPITGAEMTSLRLQHNLITPEGFATIAASIADHQHLEKIVIDQNNVSSVGAEAFAQALESNPMVYDLTISRSDIRNEGAAAISELIRVNTRLTKLNLEMNDISTPGIVALSGALQENSALRVLHLGVNPIFPAGAAHLAKMLKKNTGLYSLNVRYSGLQDSGVVSLAGALQENDVLRDLDIWFNMLTDVGSEAIGHMLKKNERLERLNLWDNNITDVGAQAIADGLIENKRLESLHMGRNEELTDGAAVHFQRALYKNENLVFLDFGTTGTKIGPTFQQPLMKASACNGKLKKALREAQYEEQEASVREEGAKCRNGALSRVPLRVSIKDMMRAQGIDPVKRRQEAVEAAKNMAKLQEEMAKLSPEEQKEVKRLLKKYKESMLNQTKEKGGGEAQEAKIKVNSPHQEHLEHLKKQGRADLMPDGPLKDKKPEEATPEEAKPKKQKQRATREKQEKNKKKKREAAKKEEL